MGVRGSREDFQNILNFTKNYKVQLRKPAFLLLLFAGISRPFGVHLSLLSKLSLNQRNSRSWRKRQHISPKHLVLRNMVDTVLTFLKKEGFTENDIPEIRRSTPIAAPFLQKCSIISYLKEVCGISFWRMFCVAFLFQGRWDIIPTVFVFSIFNQFLCILRFFILPLARFIKLKLKCLAHWYLMGFILGGKFAFSLTLQGFSACAAEVLYDHYHSKGAAAVAINSCRLCC